MDENLRLALISAIEAGEEILKVYAEAPEVEYKSDNSPLTKADKNSHLAIMKRLSASGLPVLSEEGKTIAYEERSEWKIFWLIDPLDGTKEFIKKNGEFTVNIALISDGKPILGVVYVPVTRVLYFATQESGSFKETVDTAFDESKIEEIVNTAVSLRTGQYPDIYTIVASRSHSTQETTDFIAQKEKEYDRIELISAGSSLKLCLVAERRAHIYPRLAPTMEWDTAAGHAVAYFSDCKVFDFLTGEELIYNKENLLNPWFVVASAGENN